MELMKNGDLKLILGETELYLQKEVYELEDKLKETELYKLLEFKKKAVLEAIQKKEDLKKQIFERMIAEDIEIFQKSGIKFEIKKGRKSTVLEVEDIDLIPAEYIKIERKVDIAKIKELAKETGVLISGTNYIEKIGEPTLEIKSK